MRYVLVTLGSAGDLHPFLALARELRKRHHDVLLLSQMAHEAEVVREGVAFAAIASQRDHERTQKHPDLWHPIRGFGVLWRHLLVPAARPTVSKLEELLASSTTPLTILASPLALGARVFKDLHPRTRLLTVYTAPTALRSVAEPMFIGAWKVPEWTPHWSRRWLWRALDAWKLEPMARPHLRALERQYHLGEARGSTFGDWLPSPDGGMALFPRSFCPPADDWPIGVEQFGFPLFQATPKAVRSDPLEDYMSGGPAPVLLTSGTAGNPQVATTCNIIANRLAERGFRTIRLEQALLPAGQTPAGEPPSADRLILPWLDLPALMPRLAGIVHHGGIGTCALAWACQTPQVILPSAYDQHENGWRMAQLGNAIELNPWPIKTSHLDLVSTFIASSLGGGRGSRRIQDVSTAEQSNAAVMAACDWLQSSDQRRNASL